MTNSALFWFALNIVSIITLAFYSMLEMACVSFNKVRLQYYVSKGYKRAIWINYLLQHPSRLFGTTLIGVNIALVVGSECARQFYSAIGLNPDLAPLTQVILVVIFGELAPMFAARLYAEHVALLGIPLIYASAKLMTPLLWCVDIVSKLCNMIVGGQEDESKIYLNQEELLKILEEQSDEVPTDSESAEFSAIAANIFALRGKDIKQIMEPIIPSMVLPDNASLKQFEELLNKTGADCIPLYNQNITNIIAIAYPRDMIRVSETHRVRDHARPPWFVSENASIMQILKQFRTNNESVAVILNQNGKALGLIYLSDVLEEIFGTMTYGPRNEATKQKLMLIEKTFPGDMTIAEFDDQYGVLLDKDPTITLSELITYHLGHHPEKGDEVYIGPFELIVKETSLTGVKTITISSRM